MILIPIAAMTVMISGVLTRSIKLRNIERRLDDRLKQMEACRIYTTID